MKLIIFCAVTLDGKIARSKNDPVNWTSKEDKKIFASETKKAGVVIMGHNTFKTLGKPLKERLNLVVTSSLKGKKNQRGVLEYVSAKPESIARSLKRGGFKKAFIIGGAQINSLFLKENLVNEIWLTLVPKTFGRGVPLLKDRSEKNLKLLSVKRLSHGFLLLKYYVTT